MNVSLLTRRRRFLFSVLIVAGVAYVMLLGQHAADLISRRKIEVKVTNRSSHELSAVTVVCSGGSSTLLQMKPHEVAYFEVFAMGESDATCTYRDENNQEHGQVLDVYLEPSDLGCLELGIDEHLSLHVEKRPTIFLRPPISFD